MLYEIPNELISPRLFGYRVSLVSAEELAKRPGLNDVFASWVTSFDSLVCEVVSEDEALLQRVHLYNDWSGQNITETVLRLYSKIISVKTDPFSQLALASRSINRQTEVKYKVFLLKMYFTINLNFTGARSVGWKHRKPVCGV